MEQAGSHRDGIAAPPRRRRPVWALIVAGSLVASVVAAVILAWPSPEATLVLRSTQQAAELRSVSVDLGIVTDDATDWVALDGRLEDAGATAVYLNAGRVEFTAFDWPDHPDDAAAPGTDHIARAAQELRTGADGQEREIGLIVDTFIPEWIEADPSVAGVAADGSLARYRASASQLTHGEVGERLVAFVAEVGERYEPNQIAVTELFLDRFSFGEDDLALFRTMTGESDWPRTADGLPDESSPVLGAWRSDVISGLLERMRAALDPVRDGRGADIALAMDVRVNWDDPLLGPAPAGQDYSAMLKHADRLVLWAYLSGSRPASDIEHVSRALATAGYDMSRLTVSVGLWDKAPDATAERIPTETLAQALAQAPQNGIEDVDVTPLSLMTDDDWAALRNAWRPAES